MYDYHCGRCGGLVPEPMKAYSYAGRYCHCAEPLPPKQVAVTATTSVTKTHNTREVLNATNEILALIPHIDGFKHSSINHKVDEIIHQELQKARETWLREEIVKLEGMKKEERQVDYDGTGLYEGGFNSALEYILDRHQSELDQPNK